MVGLRNDGIEGDQIYKVAFHGTPSRNIPSVVENGLLVNAQIANIRRFGKLSSFDVKNNLTKFLMSSR